MMIWQVVLTVITAMFSECSLSTEENVVCKPVAFILSKNRTKPKFFRRPMFPESRKKLGDIYSKARSWLDEKSTYEDFEPTLGFNWERKMEEDIKRKFYSRESKMPDVLVTPEIQVDESSKRVKRFFTNADDEFTLVNMMKAMKSKPANNETMVNVLKEHREAIFKKYEKPKTRENRSPDSTKTPFKSNNKTGDVSNDEQIIALNKTAIIPLVQEIADSLVNNDNGIDSFCLLVKLPPRGSLKNMKKENANPEKRCKESASVPLKMSANQKESDIVNYNFQNNYIPNIAANNSEIAKSGNIIKENNEYPVIVKQIQSMMTEANIYYTKISSELDKLYNELIYVNAANND